MLVGQWLFLIVCFFGAVVGNGHHVVVQVLTLRSRGTAARARQPLTFTLDFMPEIESLRLAISTWAKLLPQVKIVWLFGSRANDTAREDSDVDIAVELDDSAISGEDPFTYWHFESKNMLSSIQIIIRPAGGLTLR